MKKFLFWISTLILTSIIASCTTDEYTVAPKNATNNPLAKMGAITPENTANVYDTIGRIHNKVLDTYLSAGNSYTSIAAINAEIQSLTNSYSSPAIGIIAETPSPVPQIEGIINAPEARLQAAITNSYLTSPAKSSLTSFINSLLLLQQAEYEEIYPFITGYESTVIASTLFNDQDRRVILTTTSVVRYSFYYGRKRRKDKDWETLVGNIAATIEGALENSITAVSLALVTGISQQSIAPD